MTSQDRVEEQLLMFEAESCWQVREGTRLGMMMTHLVQERPTYWVKCRARDIERQMIEINNRARALGREHKAWLEGEGIREAVEEIMRQRKIEKGRNE